VCDVSRLVIISSLIFVWCHELYYSVKFYDSERLLVFCIFQDLAFMLHMILDLLLWISIPLLLRILECICAKL
jgi:hypothetical protein